MIIISLVLLFIFAFITIQDISLGVLILIALLPSYLIRFSIWEIPTTFLEGMLIIVIAIWIWKRRSAILNLFYLPRSWFILITLLLIAATVGIFISPDHQSAFGIWKAYYIEPILFFFIVLDLLKYSHITKEKIFRVLGVSALVVALFAIVQWIFQIGIPIPWDIERRVTGVFEYPNALALFLGPVIVLSWFECVREHRNKNHLGWKWFWVAVNFFGLIAIVLAQSEAAVAALIITAFLILVLQKKTRLYTIVFSIFGAVLLFSFPLTQNYLMQKFTFQDSSEQVRVSQWKETVELLKDHPVFGVGLSGYPIALKPYHRAVQYEIFQYPHNIILNIWVELGLLGLIGFVWLILLIFHSISTQAGSWDPAHNTPIFFIFFEMTTHSLVDVPYFKNDLALLTWILFAIFLYDYISQKTKHSNT